MVSTKERTTELEMDLRAEIAGVDQHVPLLDGSAIQYVNLDNAASTPALKRVMDKVQESVGWYSSIHRGSGFKSMLSTQLYEQARELVLDYVGADQEQDVIIFCKNTTEALNKLSNRFPFNAGDMVLTTGIEHHSNDLPWRAKAQVLHAAVKDDGSLDMEDFQAKLEKFAGQIKLVAVTGGSNVTGYMPPVHEIAEMAHAHGAMISVDCAQLLPHRRVDMEPHGSPRHLDFISFSAHKIYAPMGSGGLVGPKDFFNRGEPDVRGGGTVEIVTLKEVTWTGAPERDEAGSPNVIGALALATSLKFLDEVGMEMIARHEAALTRHALKTLKAVKGVRVYGLTDEDAAKERLGVIPFAMDGVTHGKLAAILGFEGGIGVRNGCFCAHPYILRLLGVTDEEYRYFHDRVMDRNRVDLPGLVRMSFGCYNNLEDIDRLGTMLSKIADGDYRGDYRVDRHSGTYYPKGFNPESVREEYFKF